MVNIAEDKATFIIKFEKKSWENQNNKKGIFSKIKKRKSRSFVKKCWKKIELTTNISRMKQKLKLEHYKDPIRFSKESKRMVWPN